MAEAIKVAVRVRPFNQREKDLGSTCVVSMSGKETVIQTDPAPKTFTYDYSYWTHTSPSDPAYASQETLMNDIGVVILENAYKGFNGCLFAYGQTGAGKSYSVMGGGDSPGIIPRSVEAIFKDKDKMESSGDSEFRIWIAFVEIYNEQCRDLLHPGGETCELKVMEHPDMGVYIPGLTEAPCKKAEDVQKLMDFGTKKRVVAATNMNATSSRSHAVFTVKVQRLQGAPPEEGKKDARKAMNAKINLVDLAGSERVNKTGAEGATLKEGCAINQSLSALGMVIKELSEAMAKVGSKKGGLDKVKDQVSFRASKLTFLLKDSLAGNSKTFMIAALSPASDNTEETLSTLRFASSVKKIKTVAKVNMDKKDEMIQNLQAEIKKLKAATGKAGGVEGVGEEIQEDLQERERLLNEMKKTYDHQLEEATHLEAARDDALKDMGLSGDEIDEVFGIEKDTPYMLNMSDDPSLTGCLMYFLKPGIVTTIGSNEENGIVLKGLGIPDHLCQIENIDQKKIMISMSQVPGEAGLGPKGRVCVNGNLLSGDTGRQLKHSDKIFFGRAYAMRLVIPAAAKILGTAESMALSEDLHEQDLIKSLVPEDSEAWGELQLYLEDLWQRLGEERGRDLFQHLSEASHLVDEANDITAEMRPADRMKFEVELVWDIHRDAQDIIVIRVMQFPPDGMDASVLCYWTLVKFKERLDMMRDCYDVFHHKGEWSAQGDCLEDPWLEPSIVELKHRMHCHAEGEVRKSNEKSDILDDAEKDVAKVPGAKAAVAAKGKAAAKADPKALTNGRPLAKAAGKAVAKSKASVKAVAKREVLEDKTVVTDDVTVTTTVTETPFAEAVTTVTEEVITISNGPSEVPPPIAASPAGATQTAAQTAAVLASKDTLIAVLREQLKDKEDKEDLYKHKIAALQQQVSLYEQQNGRSHSPQPVHLEGEHVISREILRPWAFNGVPEHVGEPHVVGYKILQEPTLQPRTMERLTSRSPLMTPVGRQTSVTVPQTQIQFTSTSPPRGQMVQEQSPHMVLTQPSLAQSVGYPVGRM